MDWPARAESKRLDLAAIENGGLVLGASDKHFGSKDNLIMPGRSKNMGDGWETRRRRGPGHDWLILRLGGRGTIDRIEIDTNHFKGNYPDSRPWRAAAPRDSRREVLASDSLGWQEILPRTKLGDRTTGTSGAASSAPADPSPTCDSASSPTAA